MKKYLFIIITLMTLITLSATQPIVKEKNGIVDVELIYDDYTIYPNGDFSNISTKSAYSVTSEEGAPDIPYKTYFVQVSKNSKLDISQSTIQSSQINLESPIQPIPTIRTLDNIHNYKIDNEKYMRNQNNLFEIGNKFYTKGSFYFPLRVYPFRYDGNLSLQVIEKLHLKIYISNPIKGMNESAFKIDRLSHKNFNKAIPEYTTRDSIEYAQFSKSDFWYKFDIHKDGMYKLNYSDLNNLPLEDIDPQTIRIFSTGGATITMSHTSTGFKFTEIPITILGEEDGTFDEDDHIIFYGRNRDGDKMNILQDSANDIYDTYYYINRFSEATTYWLTFATNFPTIPKRIPNLTNFDSFDEETDSHTFQSHYEQENIKRNALDFEWYMSQIGGAVGQSHVYNIEIEDLVDGSQATVGFGLREESTSDNNTHYHQFNLYMNDSTVADDNISWTNRTYFDGEANLSTLQNGTNTLKMQAQSPYIINFDFFDFRYSQYLNYTNKQFFINTDGFSYNQNYRLVFQNNFENDYDVYQLNSFSEIGTIQEQDTNSKLSFIANIYEDTKFIVMKESDYLEIENIESYFPNILTDITQEPADFLIITPEKFLSNANELISVHQEYSNLVGKPILQQDIFNQFNGGMPDPEAIRIFLEYYFSNISNDLEAVIFFGSGTFDWRNFTGNANTKNNLIYYQDDSYPYSVSDDYFVRFTVSSFPEIATGRYPATNSAELTAMIDKTRKYLQNNLAGYWKEKVLIVADDIYHSSSSNDRSHSTQAQTQGETLADFMYADKLFAIEYELDGFQNKPEASDEFVRRINEGRLISYYIGHGSYKKLGDEEYFDALTDIPALTNSEKLTLFIAASCSVAQDDSYAYDSLAKKMFVYNNGGAFASIAATRACGGSANTNLMKTFMDYVLEDGETIGEALRLAKVIHNSSNSERYIIFGDPLVHLNYPHPLENIDFSTQFDSLQARQTVEFSGDFELSQNSDAILCIYDSEQDKRFDYSYTTNSGIIYSHIDYTQSSNRLFNGTVSLENGEFDSAFIVPDDIYGGNDGKLFTYLYDSVNNIDYNCYHAPIKFRGHDYIAESDTPPEIEIYIDNETFQNDDVVSKSPLLIANISDENGLNILAEPGHNMIMIIDDSGEPINVTSGFIYNKDSYTSGQLTWQIEELEEGEHKLDLIVFDNFNNPAIATAKFFTKSDNKLSIDNLLPYPSPFTGEREFHFTFTLTEKADVSVYIYTISGKKIKTITSYNLSSGFVKIPWNGKDADGDKIANGTYFYKVRAKDNLTGDTKEAIEKLIIYR